MNHIQSKDATEGCHDRDRVPTTKQPAVVHSDTTGDTVLYRVDKTITKVLLQNGSLPMMPFNVVLPC